MQKWIWYQESLTRKFIIKSFAKNSLLQNIKKWTLQKNKEKYAVIKQSKMMTKMNQKMEKLGKKLLVPFELLHDVILCFWNIVFVFRIYDWKKFSIWLIFYVFLFQTLLSQNAVFGTPAKISQECCIQSAWNFHAFFSTLSTILYVEKIWVGLILTKDNSRIHP